MVTEYQRQADFHAQIARTAMGLDDQRTRLVKVT